MLKCCVLAGVPKQEDAIKLVGKEPFVLSLRQKVHIEFIPNIYGVYIIYMLEYSFSPDSSRNAPLASRWTTKEVSGGEGL